MATYAEVKTRIITEMVRDDLEDDLADQLTTHIARACEFFADERFWFNAIITTAPTVAANSYVTIPATVRRVERVYIPALDSEVRPLTIGEITEWESVTGQPSAYAYYNDTLRIWPLPDAIYTLQLIGTAQIDAPTDDADENVWTDEAQDLIVARYAAHHAVIQYQQGLLSEHHPAPFTAC